MAGPEDEALDELYRADLDAFTARRNELAKELKGAGDGAAADRLKALKKPTRAAWALNRLSAENAKLRKEVLAAGAALRKAQEKLVAGKGDRAAVRAATEREREVVGKALEVAAGLGPGLSAAALEHARETLHAVALDDEVRHEFEQHRLTADHSAIGTGGFAVDAAAAAAPSRRDELRAAEAELKQLERAETLAERRLGAAREKAERAQGDLERAAEQLESAAAPAEAARKRVEKLRRRS